MKRLDAVRVAAFVPAGAGVPQVAEKDPNGVPNERCDGVFFSGLASPGRARGFVPLRGDRSGGGEFRMGEKPAPGCPARVLTD